MANQTYDISSIWVDGNNPTESFTLGRIPEGEFTVAWRRDGSTSVNEAHPVGGTMQLNMTATRL